MTLGTRSIVVFAAALCASACRSGDAQQTGSTGAAAPAYRPEFVPAEGAGDARPVVAREVARAKSEGRQLLVYVGAPWCEPCTRFHHALERGELDTAFPNLRLLEFDAERDGERLRAAGYTSRLIPLFVVPAADGSPTVHRMEGSIKGEGAVGEIVPRLERLLERSRSGGL